MSELIANVRHLLNIKKVNTSEYHPQTAGLVERFHQTLITMFSMYVEMHGQDWDHYLPYMLYAYRISAQESTHESPFFLMFGRNPRQPTEEALSCPTRKANHLTQRRKLHTITFLHLRMQITNLIDIKMIPPTTLSVNFKLPNLVVCTTKSI